MFSFSSAQGYGSIEDDTNFCYSELYKVEVLGDWFARIEVQPSPIVLVIGLTVNHRTSSIHYQQLVVTEPF